MMKRRNETLAGPRDSATATAILDAARRLFLQFGLRRTTMEDIAAALGKKKSFLYYYFPGKAEVLAALARREFSLCEEAIRRAVERESAPEDRLRAFTMARAAQVVERMEEIRRLRASAHSPEDVVEYLQMNEFRRGFEESSARYLAGLLREGVQAGRFRPLSDEEVDCFCGLAASSQRGVELDLILHPELAAEHVRRSRPAFDLLLTGLLPRPADSPC